MLVFMNLTIHAYVSNQVNLVMEILVKTVRNSKMDMADGMLTLHKKLSFLLTIS